MPVTPQDRPIEALREQTVDQLIMNYGHGHLSREAFERRLDQALDAESTEQLVELTRDLDLKADTDYTAQKKAELGIRVEPTATADEVEHMINVFGGTTRRGAWDVPGEIKLINVFGGSELDFSNARFTARTTRIMMFCMFGGASFRVHEGMRVKSKAICIFGGVDNRAGSPSDPDAPTLIIEGIALFGGADIRIKKTPKQRFQEFANTLRSMFDPEPPRA
ncbi:MAG TPA: DUF1707 domain-containing protein [Gammaproteobacteria bacterium]|jgi:hypothetical protein|nr:DUF1707 domain-containing protein [Gammaproteobacteria bacterium]